MIKYPLQYQSLGALVAASLGASEMKDPDRVSRAKTNQGNAGWFGATWDQAKAAALAGDLEGAKKLSASILETLRADQTSGVRIDPVYRLDGGHFVDIARYVKGEPESWVEMTETEPMPKKGLALIVNLSTNGGMTAEGLDDAGAAIGSVVLGLQAKGVPVTLYISKYIRGNGNTAAVISAAVNPGGSPLNVAHLSTVIRPWFTRRVLFSLYETQEAPFRRAFQLGINGAYGQTCRLTRDIQRLIAPTEAVSLIIEMEDAYRDPGYVKRSILRRAEAC